VLPYKYFTTKNEINYAVLSLQTKTKSWRLQK